MCSREIGFGDANIGKQDFANMQVKVWKIVRRKQRFPVIEEMNFIGEMGSLKLFIQCCEWYWCKEPKVIFILSEHKSKLVLSVVPKDQAF